MAKKKIKPRTAQRIPPSPATGKKMQLLPLFAAILTFLVYLPALENDFVPNWDDGGYVLEYPPIQQINAENLQEIFTAFYKGNYHPLTTLVYAIQYSLASDDPFLYHLVNVLFHVFNTLLVFLLVRRLFRQPMTAFWAAVIFGVHPMHVESVAWISELKDVMYTFFYLLSLLGFLHFLEHRKGRDLLLSLIFFILSLLSKSAAVTLPLVAVLIGWYRQQRLRWSYLLTLAPYFALAAAFGVIAILSQGQQGAIQDLTPLFSGTDRFFIVCYAFMIYVVKFIFPHNLMAMYPYPSDAGGSFPLEVYLSPIGVALFLVGILIALRKARIPAFGGIFFILTSILTLQILPVGGAVVAERYTYIPYIGLSLAPIWLLVRHLQEPRMLAHWKHLLLAGFSVFLILGTLQRIPVWKDGLTLFNDVIEKNPRLPFAYNNRGFAYQKYYNDMDQALADYSTAIRNDSTYYRSLSNRGVVLFNLGRVEEAIADFTRSLRYRPDNEDALLGRANSLSSLGQYAEAIPDYNNYLLLKPGNAEAWKWRAIAYFNTRDLDAAAQDILQSLRIDESADETWYWRGLIAREQGLKDEAMQAMDQAIVRNPQRADSYLVKGLLYYEAGEYPEAIAAFDLLLRMNPSYAPAYVNRSAAYSGMERYREALADLQQARQLGYPVNEAYYNEILRKAGGNP